MYAVRNPTQDSCLFAGVGDHVRYPRYCVVVDSGSLSTFELAPSQTCAGRIVEIWIVAASSAAKVVARRRTCRPKAGRLLPLGSS
jgi:hypothetical protein